MTFGQNSKKNVFFFVGIFFLGIFLGSLGVFYIFGQNAFPLNNEKKQEIHNNSHFFNTPKVEKLYKIISENFYGFERKNQKELEDAFLSAMVKSLGDKHSEYFNEVDAKELRESLDNNFVGIGAVISEHPLGIKIDKILEDSPAQKHGLKVGDIMFSVNSYSLEGLTAEEGVRLVRGEEGSIAHIDYYREGKKQSVDVVRGVVHVPSVESRFIEDTKIGYIQINTFSDQTDEELKKHLRELYTNDVKGIILDFRFNGGGYLTSAQNILSEFLPRRQRVLAIKKNNQDDEIVYTNIFSHPNTQIPLVVLVNDLSASASEIVAGALQDYDRAIIVGTKTYGKGSVQEVMELGNTILKLTVAHWYTPKDKNIDAEGITPDVIVDFESQDYEKKFDRQLDVATDVINNLIDGNDKYKIIEIFKEKSLK